MARHLNHSFINQTIAMDGETFIDCSFINCRLVYAGTAEVELQGCTMQQCGWFFDGAAARTLGMLRSMYAGGFKDEVEQAIAGIRAAA